MRRKSLYVLVPLLSIFLTLLAVEAGFELLGPVPHSLETDAYYVSDPFTGYRLQPNGFVHYQHGILASVNAHGHRDTEVSLAKSPGVFRVLVLGDSFTMGANVEQEKVYPQVLELLLTTNNTQDLEVINAGVGGWGPFHYAEYYRHYGREFQPDVVLVGFYVGNDTNDAVSNLDETNTAVMGRRVSRSAAASWSIRWRIFAYQNSHIARLIVNTNRPINMLDFTRTDCRAFTRQYIETQAHALRSHLKAETFRREAPPNSIAQILRLKGLADDDGIRMAVVLIPTEIQINEDLRNVLVTGQQSRDYDFGMPQSMLTRIFQRNSISVIDLLPAFLEDAGCPYMNDTHWAEEGHELAAREIHRRMREMNLLPEGLRAPSADGESRLEQTTSRSIAGSRPN